MSCQKDMDVLISDLQMRIHPIEPCICEIYISVLQALKLMQSQWYPVIRIDYVVYRQIGYLETLLHNLEELQISSDSIAIMVKLFEMINFLIANLLNLSIQGLEFHPQHIDSVIVDAGLLVYSLNDTSVLDFPVKIQRLQAMVYVITRKTFLLQFNLSGIDELGTSDIVIDKLENLLYHYSHSIASVKRQIQKIQKEFRCFQAAVEQHDELQHFATRVIGLAYEVEYIVDGCTKEEIPDWCLFLWILHIGEDIREVMVEVAEIQEKNLSDIVSDHTKDAVNAHTSSQFARNPGMNEEMVGFKDVMNELRGRLTEGSSNVDIISIVGMPGAGKTTVANKLYFDQSVITHFDICAQCCVSQEYTLKNLLLTILGDLIVETAKLGEEAENVLADKLRKLLFRRRYLILIDDIWDTNVWDDLKLCFHDANNGSRIILTTRHYDVASHAKHDTDPLVLRMMSNDESWILLQNKVFNKESCPAILKDVGKRIAQKCGGLPLSIVLVAGTLTRMEKRKHCWEQVAADLGPHIQAQSKDTINLSYHNLPHHLKSCFLYFGLLFSEDREIQVSKLTWLWISEGFVKSQTEKLLEDIAEEYLQNLVERNLVVVTKKSVDGKIKACRIHNLLLEFCREKAKLENFFERIKGDIGMDPSRVFPPICKTSRRLSLYSHFNNFEKWSLYFSHVKSFQFRDSRKFAFSSIDRALYTFRRFKFLRVLDLEFTIVDSFPQELTLLKYLAFRTAEDTLTLPTNLWNLETLIVHGIRVQISVPDTIWKMVKLRHLHIYYKASSILDNRQELLESLSKMSDLQTLSSAYFSCMKHADMILAKTPNLLKLRCEVLKFDESILAFNYLTKLEMLKISSGPTFTTINQLKLPSQLKKLTLSNFRINLNEVTGLSNLEVLKLLGGTISSNTWKVNDEQFCKLSRIGYEIVSAETVGKTAKLI